MSVYVEVANNMHHGSNERDAARRLLQDHGPQRSLLAKLWELSLWPH